MLFLCMLSSWDYYFVFSDTSYEVNRYYCIGKLLIVIWLYWVADYAILFSYSGSALADLLPYYTYVCEWEKEVMSLLLIEYYIVMYFALFLYFTSFIYIYECACVLWLDTFSIFSTIFTL